MRVLLNVELNKKKKANNKKLTFLKQWKNWKKALVFFSQRTFTIQSISWSKKQKNDSEHKRKNSSKVLHWHKEKGKSQERIHPAFLSYIFEKEKSKCQRRKQDKKTFFIIKFSCLFFAFLVAQRRKKPATKVVSELNYSNS